MDRRDPASSQLVLVHRSSSFNTTRRPGIFETLRGLVNARTKTSKHLVVTYDHTQDVCSDAGATMQRNMLKIEPMFEPMYSTVAMRNLYWRSCNATQLRISECTSSTRRLCLAAVEIQRSSG
jgi:hypothetical protein